MPNPKKFGSNAYPCLFPIFANVYTLYVQAQNHHVGYQQS